MNNKLYTKIAKLIMESEDTGGELVKLLCAVDEKLLDKKEGILITQAVPKDNGNPIVHIAVFTNRQTDFPLDSEESYKNWVKEYCDSIWEEGVTNEQ